MVSQKGTKPKRMNRYKERRLQRKAMLALEQSKLSSKGSGGGEQSTNSEVMVLEEDGWPRYIPEKPIISNNKASTTSIPPTKSSTSIPPPKSSTNFPPTNPTTSKSIPKSASSIPQTKPITSNLSSSSTTNHSQPKSNAKSKRDRSRSRSKDKPVSEQRSRTSRFTSASRERSPSPKRRLISSEKTTSSSTGPTSSKPATESLNYISIYMYDQLAKKQDLIDIQMTLNSMMKLQRETTNLLIKHFETQSSRDTHPDPIRRETTDNTRETEILIERVSRISSGISNSSVNPNVSRVSKKDSKSSSGSKGGGHEWYYTIFHCP